MMRRVKALVMVVMWVAASPSSQMSIRRQLPQFPDADTPPSTLIKDLPPSTLIPDDPSSSTSINDLPTSTTSLLLDGPTSEGADGGTITETSDTSPSEAGNGLVLSLSQKPVTSCDDHQVTSSDDHQVTSSDDHQVTSSDDHQVTSSDDHQVTSSDDHQVTSSDDHQVAQGDVNPDVQAPSGSSGHQGLQVSSGDPGVDFLLATLGDSVNGDQRSVMALLQSLMVDGEEDTRAMDMVRKTHGGRKKAGPQGHTEGQQLEDRTGKGHLGEGNLEELGQLGEAGKMSLQQQMAEFTLEPHLGPAILPFEVPEGYFVPFLPRRAFGVENGVSRPPHGHGSFYVHRSPGLVDIPNSPAYGFLFSGYRRFDPEAPRIQEE